MEQKTTKHFPVRSFYLNENSTRITVKPLSFKHIHTYTNPNIYTQSKHTLSILLEFGHNLFNILIFCIKVRFHVVRRHRATKMMMKMTTLFTIVERFLCFFFVFLSYSFLLFGEKVSNDCVRTCEYVCRHQWKRSKPKRNEMKQMEVDFVTMKCGKTTTFLAYIFTANAHTHSYASVLPSRRFSLGSDLILKTPCSLSIDQSATTFTSISLSLSL